jgi:hypothetical protein
VADRFVVIEGAAADGDGPGRRVDRSEPPALRTGLLIAEPLELDLEDLFDGPLDHSLADVDGQGFDLIKVEIQPRPLLSEGPLGDDFSPSVGHLAKLGQILGLTLGEGHRWFVLELGDREELGNRS